MLKILITGVTGSLGKRLAKHYLGDGWEVRGLSRCENKQAEMKREYPKIEFVLGDVRDYETCKRACNGIDLVIHTAALKRIEFGEEFTEEFIKTNLLGTMNVAKAAKFQGCEMVFVSTDKACKPINTYGMTKALAEKFVTGMGFNCVRYGNVCNSRGSVLPYWKELSKKGKPIPLTNKEMTRFTITFDQAIEMIELAANNPMKGNIFIPKLPRIKMKDVALFYGDEIVEVGERPGEKLHEILINEDEGRLRVTEHSNYYIIHRDIPKEPDVMDEYSSNGKIFLNEKGIEIALKEVLP